MMKSTIIITTVLSVAALGIVFSTGLVVGAILVSNDMAVMNRLIQLEQASVARGSAANIEALMARLASMAGETTPQVDLNTARVTVELDGAPIRGPMEAPVTIVEFGDFQCPFCSRVSPALARLLEEYPDDVRLVFKHLPLGFHENAEPAARAAVAAQLQGRFWEMHDLLFAHQELLDTESYISHAETLELDIDKFIEDMDSDFVRDLVSKDVVEADSLGVSGTPGFFINGRYLSGARPYDEFKQMVEAELSENPRG